MSAYHFGCGRGRISARKAKQIDQIAKRHEARFFAVDMPEGPRYWFSKPNEGAPWDQRLARSVVADLEAAGLWPIEVAS